MSEENPKQLKKRTALVMAWDSNVKASVSEKLLHLLGDFNYNPDSLRVLTVTIVLLPFVSFVFFHDSLGSGK